MKRWILLIIAVNLLAILALVFVQPDAMLAPGALIPAHQSLANDCFACHAPLQGAEESRCTTCHKVADIGLLDVAGTKVLHSSPITPFHQGLADSDCLGCHTDHPMASLTPPHSHTFAHGMLTEAAGAVCSSCHTAPETSVHEGVTEQCSTCHAQSDWSSATIDHQRFFALSGPHDVTCSRCHTTANDFKPYSCYSCHEHNEADLIREHSEEGISDIDNCVECHRDANADGSEHGERSGRSKSGAPTEHNDGE